MIEAKFNYTNYLKWLNDDANNLTISIESGSLTLLKFLKLLFSLKYIL